MPHDQVFQSIATRELTTGKEIIKVSSGTTAPLTIQNAGTGEGILVTQTGEGIGINVASTATVTHLKVETTLGDMTSDTTPVVLFRATGAMTTGRGVLDVVQDNVGSTKPASRFKDDGSGGAISTICSSTGPDIHIEPRAAATLGAGVEGDIYFNSTSHKLMIRGVAGWETVTSA